MDRGQLMFVVLFNLILISKYVSGEAMAYFPPDARAMHQYQFLPHYQPVSRNILPQEYMIPQYEVPAERAIAEERMVPQERITPILHTGAVNPSIPPSVPEIPMQGLNYTFGEVRDSEEDYLRASKSGYDYATHSASTYPSAPSYSYTSPGSGYSAPPSPSVPAYSPPAPAALHPTAKFPIFKPDLTSLIKPVTTKVASKVSGLIGLVLSLLTGSAPDDLEMKGFKDIIINGIVRPLLIAKGGIKSLISKLTIPVISLLLINLEVLITVWWLWEECPVSAKPIYTQPAYTSNDNHYSYR